MSVRDDFIHDTNHVPDYIVCTFYNAVQRWNFAVSINALF